MKNAVISYPRIGALRELKFTLEKYFKNELSQEEVFKTASELKKRHWQSQKEAGIDFISCNDFSFYDNVLDTAKLFNVVASRYKKLNLNSLDEYFAQARGYQGQSGDTTALAMKKWFNTNYHYLVPECDDASIIGLSCSKIFDEYDEAKAQGIEAKVVLTGLFTFYKLINFKDEATKKEALTQLKKAYIELLEKLNEKGVKWVQFDEPFLVYDLSSADIALFEEIYKELLAHKKGIKILAQTYFGDVRDIYDTL